MTPFRDFCLARHDFSVDVDAQLFLEMFDGAPGDKTLVVGAHDEPTANLLQEWGCDVTAVDLREYDEKLPPCNHRHIVGDFCDHELDLGGEYDRFVSISAIEHFGLGAYGERHFHPYYDVIAMRRAWELLKVNGVAYVTVPFGAKFSLFYPHWRVYDLVAANERLGSDFVLQSATVAVSGDCKINGVEKHIGDPLSFADACSFGGHPPHVSALFKLLKVPIHRISPAQTKGDEQCSPSS